MTGTEARLASAVSAGTGSPATALSEVNSFCDWSQIGCDVTKGPKVEHRIVAVTPPRPTADRYLEIAFKNGVRLRSGEDTGEIQMRLQKVDWSNFDESNDFSWGTNSSYLDWPKVTTLRI
jgi:hypothetical protein